MTALWSAEALCRATGGTMAVPFDISGVSIDTRTVQPGDLFVALQGDTDGHAHAAQALAKGAAGVMVHRADAVPAGSPALLVADTLEALHGLGRAGRARFGGRVVAVTGSVGKTTTKEMLRSALSAFGTVHAAQASYNNHWGVPLTLARLPADADFCVSEVGMNTAGETLPLARTVRPHVAVITTIAAAHIGRLGSMEAIAAEKAALLHGLEPGGVSVLPADSAFLPILRERAPGEVVLFGSGAEASVRLVGAEAGAESSLATIDAAGMTVRLRVRAPGAHMVANAVAALAGAVALGLDPVRAASGLEGFAAVAGRGQQRRIHGEQVLLLDESYNANTASMRAALQVLHGMPGTRHVAVLGDMLELGDFAAAEHEGLADDVARAADVVFACGPHSRALFDLVPAGRRGAHAADSAALAPIVAAAVRPGDAVLVKGSLGSRMGVIVRALEDQTFQGQG